MQIVQDLAYGARLLIRHRGFTAAAVTTLSLGIGISAAVLTIVDTVVFRPLPYGDPSRLVKICGNAGALATDDMALLDYLDIRAQNTVFEAIAADDGSTYTVEHAGVRQRAAGAIVSHDWLSTLGVHPLLGRGFTADEAEPGRDAVVVLTHAYWRRRFGSNPDVLGTDVGIDGQAHTIVGILPPNVFRYGADFVKPLVPASYKADRSYVNLDVFARLRPGITVAQASAEVATIGSRLRLAYPATNRDRGFSVIPLDRYYADADPRAARGLVLVLGAVILLLLIACANVANLVLARMLARYRECVVRVALGATRRRLIRQFLVENLLLFAAGGVGGAVIARWLLETLVRFATQEGYISERMAVALDARMLLVTLLASLAIGAAFGTTVAMSASRVDVSDGLRESTYTSPGGRGRRGMRRTLIVAELAISLVLLVGLGLVGRSFMRLQANGVGFDPDRLIETAADDGRAFPAAVSFWRTAIEHAQSVPGVRLAAVTSRPPIRGSRQRVLDVEGRAEAPDNDSAVVFDLSISADYFRTMGIPLIAGRAFDERDGPSGTPVVIVSEAMARRYFPDGNPLGRRVMLRERDSWECCSSATPVAGVWREIVGVVGDVRQHNVEDEPRATTYRPYTQIVEHDMYLMVRADAHAALPGVMAALRSRLPPPPADAWTEPRLTRDAISGSESLRRRRFMLILLGTFAGLAVLLAAVGLYGIVSGSIAERRREIGVRVALGATPRAIVWQVQAETLRLCLVSFPIGAVAAYVLSRFIASLLYGVSAADASTYVGVALFLVAVTLLASYLPARRAARTDPLEALHES
jgi:putative ABC transport system permease protein